MAIVPMTADASVAIISVTDAAIDHENSQHIEGDNGTVLEYTRDRVLDPSSWRKTVKFFDGQTPTEFVIGVCPPSELARIEDECRLGKDDERTRELYWRVFLSTIRAIRGGPVSEIKGDDGQARMGTPTKVVCGIEYVDPEWLASQFVGPLYMVALEIGRNAYWWCQLSGRDVKN